MSLETWKKEFYPKNAKSMGKATSKAATDHSIQKWIGLRKKNLVKHGLVTTTLWGWRCVGEIADPLGYDSSTFGVDSGTCALCVRFTHKEECERCPLAKCRGGVSCDLSMPREVRSPYNAWRQGADPEPMIRWLRRTKKMLEKASS